MTRTTTITRTTWAWILRPGTVMLGEMDLSNSLRKRPREMLLTTPTVTITIMTMTTIMITMTITTKTIMTTTIPRCC